MKTETAKRLLILEIKNLELAIETAGKIMPVIEKFDGKIPNKRLDTALKQIDKALSFEMKYNSFVISLFLTDRHVPDGAGTVAYVQDHSKILIHTSIKSCYNDGACQDDVIRADVVKDHLLSFVDSRIKLIEKLRLEVERLEAIIAEYDNIKKIISDFQDNTTYLTREYLKLKF